MRLVIPRETTPDETRVSLVPETVAKLTKMGIQVAVETGAGATASHPDTTYASAGATIVPGPRETYDGANVVVKVREPIAHPTLGVHESDLVPNGAVYIGFLGRDKASAAVQKLAARDVTAFSMEMIPRTSRAQKLDALSSMANIAGYEAALIAARALPKYFPLLMTAAGTIPPARAFILGAGVAGLQAIATCRRLGAQVEAFDVRPAVKEEVQSLGATFVGLELGEAGVGAGGYAKELSEEHHRKEQELIAQRLQASDVAITTAAIPGKRAPLLITRAMVEAMKPGSVIVDLAAETGGNCEMTLAGQTVDHHGVKIFGVVNAAALMPFHASQLYSRNVHALLQLMLTKEGQLQLDWEDDIIRDSCITRPQATAPAAVAAGRAAS
jgi:proton-translocating NAD(P)+ transhydrogenase subunit alpha